MTETTPDYAGLIERLHKEAARHASYDDISREGALLAEAAAAIRTLLERNAELERTLAAVRDDAMRALKENGNGE